MHIKATLDQIYDLIPELPTNRQSRGLANFVGDAAHWLFGIARDSDIDRVSRNFHKIGNAFQHVSDTLHVMNDEMSSYFQINNHRVNNLISAVDEEHRTLIEMHSYLTAEIRTMNIAASIQTKLFDKLANYVTLQSDIAQLRQGVEQLIRHELSATIIPPEILAHVIYRLQLNLVAIKPTLKLLTIDPTTFYRTANFLIIRHGTSLIITLEIPVSDMHNTFDVFSVQTFSVPIQKSDSHTFITLPKMFAQNPNFYFVIEEQMDFDHHILDARNNRLFLRPLQVKSCIPALFQEDISLVKQLCSFSVLPHKPESNVIPVSSNEFVIINVPDIILRCPNVDNQNLTSCSSICHLTMACGCSIWSDATFIPAKSYDCAPHPNNISVLYPTNLAVLQHFFDTNELMDLIGKTLLPSELNVELPNFDLYKSNHRDRLAVDKHDAYELSLLANKTKTNSKIFSNLAQTIRHDLDGMYYDTNSIIPASWQNYITILSFILSGLSIVVTIFLCIRYHMLYSTLLSTRLPTATANIPTALSYFSSTMSTTFSFDNNSDWSVTTNTLSLLEFRDTILLIFFMTLFVYLIYRYVRSSKYVLSLQIGNKHTSMTCPWYTLLHSPIHYEFNISAPIQSLSVVGILFPRLHIDWPDFSVTHVITNSVVKMPVSIRISVITAYMLRKILSRNTWVVAMVTYNKQDLSIQVKQSTVTGTAEIDKDTARPQSAISSSQCCLIPTAPLYPDLTTVVVTTSV